MSAHAHDRVITGALCHKANLLSAEVLRFRSTNFLEVKLCAKQIKLQELRLLVAVTAN